MTIVVDYTLQQLPQPTGSDAQRIMASIHARLVARYKLVAVPGRPEELMQPGTDRRVSHGYGCKSIRIRRQQGRNWLDRIDIQIREGWHAEVYEFLDDHFGFIGGMPDTPMSIITTTSPV
jgi:hypothetical protein